jgi:hypothetical protein
VTISPTVAVLAVALVGSVLAAPNPRSWLMGVCFLAVGLCLLRLL